MKPNPYEPPKEHGGERRSDASKRKEILEWLSIAPGDIPIWGAGAAILGMYYSNSTVIDTILAVAAFVLAVTGCVIGIKPDPEFSLATNTSKIILYPAAIIACIVIIYFNFVYWNQRPTSNGWLADWVLA